MATEQAIPSRITWQMNNDRNDIPNQFTPIKAASVKNTNRHRKSIESPLKLLDVNETGS